MFYRLIKLQWKSFFRSANFGKGLGVKILMGFLALYFFVSFLALGIGVYPISKEIFPNEEPMTVVNRFILIWFAGELITRFLLQNLPLMDIKPMLTQRISKNRIIHFLLTKTCYSFFNVFTLTVAIPFVLVNLKKTDYSAVQLLAWLLSVACMVYTINFINFWIQKRFATQIKALIPVILIVLILIALQFYEVFSVTAAFGAFFNGIVDYPILAIIPIALMILSYWITFRDVRKNLYLDAYISERKGVSESADLGWTNRFGALSPFLQLDLKLLWRNKRTKNVMYLCLVFLGYGFIFYSNPEFEGSAMMIFVGIFMTGIFIINFGQFIPAWDSSYFPLLKTQPITMNTYLESKALLMYGSVIVLTVLSSFYVFYGWDKLFMNVASAIYNAGVNVPVILLFGAYNRKRIDLTQKSMFNYQGVGAAQWLVGIPLILGPVLLWYPTKFLFDSTTANLLLIGFGVIGLLLRKVIIKGIAELYIEKKYVMIEGFKQKD